MARYTLRQLEIFVEAARDCNFARTAERLSISQPAISDHVRALERNLASQLFERHRGMSVVLTSAGKRLREEAKAILDRSTRLSERGAAGRRTTCLRVFAGPHILERMLRGALPAFHRDHPDISLDIYSELSPDEVSALIRRGELDLAAYTTTNSRIPADAQVLCDVPCVVLASKRLVGNGELSVQDVARIPFVLPLEGTPTAVWVDQALRQLGIAPSQVVARTQLQDVQQRMVENGDAAALLFRECFESSSVRSQLRQLSGEVSGLKRALVTRRGDRRTEVRTVAAFLTSVIAGARRAANA